METKKRPSLRGPFGLSGSQPSLLQGPSVRPSRTGTPERRRSSSVGRSITEQPQRALLDAPSKCKADYTEFKKTRCLSSEHRRRASPVKKSYDVPFLFDFVSANDREKAFVRIGWKPRFNRRDPTAAEVFNLIDAKV